MLVGYARGVDGPDDEMIRSCFRDGAVDCGPFEGQRQFVRGDRGAARFSMTMHVLDHPLNEFDADVPDVAFVETAALAFDRSPVVANETTGSPGSGTWTASSAGRRPVAMNALTTVGPRQENRSGRVRHNFDCRPTPTSSSWRIFGHH